MTEQYLCNASERDSTDLIEDLSRLRNAFSSHIIGTMGKFPEVDVESIFYQNKSIGSSKAYGS